MDRPCGNGFSPPWKDPVVPEPCAFIDQRMDDYANVPCGCAQACPSFVPLYESCFESCLPPPWAANFGEQTPPSCMPSCDEPYPCPPFPCEPPCKKRPPRPCEQELCDILESVARVEAALSHILNAEGEKLQRILQLSDEPQEIMAVNNSIIETLASATHLEYVLFEKLRLAERMRDVDCKPPAQKSKGHPPSPAR